ncbi:flocculation protein FLO11-like [Zingiber officinale]|uniref:flocculation protein FLO11-like n=1 Tax=Zingiber officinale TaxID=94328 RepID=UPI001C4DC8A9|nr:flocculation protein FLO11-like [Zingiber officinale]
MAEETIAPWYTQISSSFDKDAQLAIRLQYEIPMEYDIIIPNPDEHPHHPPANLANFYAALINEELRQEEAQLHAKEQELLTALNQPSSTEVSAPPTEASSSQVVPEVPEGLLAETTTAPFPTVSSLLAVTPSVAIPLLVIELTSPVSIGKSPVEIVPSKRPGCKLTRAPPSKRRLTLSAEELSSEDFAPAAPSSTESTLTDLYPSLLFSSSPSTSNTALGGTSFTFPLSVPESGPLPSSLSSYLIFAPPSIPTASFSASSSTIPVLPILLGVTDLNAELSSKLEKQTAETNKLKSDYESTLAEKLKALQLKDDEITSLNTSLNTARQRPLPKMLS